MKLFESNAKPHHYMCGAKFSRPHLAASWYNSKCFPMTFYEAFTIFKKFFLEKTGLEWDNRLEKAPRSDDTLFVYTPPILGRPIGLVPHGYVRPELREESCAGEKNVAYDTDSEVDEE